MDRWGRVLVVDGQSGIQMFDSEGAFLGRWGGGWATADGEFQSPKAIAVDPWRNVFVADTGNSRIQKFHRDFAIERVEQFGNSFAVEWYAAGGATYHVWGADNLPVGSGGWELLGEVVSSRTGVVSWADSGLHALGPASKAQRRFYRICENP